MMSDISVANPPSPLHLNAVYACTSSSSLSPLPVAPNCNSPQHLTSPHQFQSRRVSLSAQTPNVPSAQTPNRVTSGGSSPHSCPYKMAKIIGVSPAQEQLQPTQQNQGLMYQTREDQASQLPLLEELSEITKSLDVIGKASRHSEAATAELQSTVQVLRQDLDAVRRMQHPLAEHQSGEVGSSAWSEQQVFAVVAGIQGDVGSMQIQQQQQAIQLHELEQRVAEHLRGLKEQQQSEALMLRQELEQAVGAGSSSDHILDLLSRMVEATMNGLPAAPGAPCNYVEALDAERRERDRELGELASFINTSLAEVRAEVASHLASSPLPETCEVPQHLESFVKALLRPERDARADLARSLEAERGGRVQDLQNERDSRVREMSDLRATIQHLAEQFCGRTPDVNGNYEAGLLDLQRKYEEVSSAVGAIYDGQVGVPRDYLEAMEAERQERDQKLAELTAFVQEIRQEIFTTVNAAFDETRVDIQTLAQQLEEGPKLQSTKLESTMASLMQPMFDREKQHHSKELEAERHTRMKQVADLHAATDHMSERVSACQESLVVLGDAERGLAQHQESIEIRLSELAACVQLVHAGAQNPTVEEQAKLMELAPLRVTVLGARGLRDADWLPGAGKSDPYCVCELEGKPQATKIETQVISDTCDPNWGFEGSLTDYVAGDSLVFKVYDKDVGKTDDFLGFALLPGEHFHPHGFEGELPLQNTGRGILATLQLKVAPATGKTHKIEQIDHQGQQYLAPSATFDLQGEPREPCGQDFDVAKLVGLVSEEAGRWRDTDRLRQQAMAEISNRVEQLWHGVEAVGAESQAHTVELQLLLNVKEEFHEVQADFSRVAGQQATVAHTLSKLLELRDQVDVMWSERRTAPALPH